MRLTLGVFCCSLTLICTGCPPPSLAPAGHDAQRAQPSATPIPKATASEEPVPVGPPVLVEQRLAENAYVMGWSPSGLHLAIGTTGGVHLVEAETGRSRGVLPEFANAGKFTSDGRFLTTLHTDSGYANIWDLSNDTRQFLRIPEGIEAVTAGAGDRVLLGHRGGVTVIEPRTANVQTYPLADKNLRILAVQDAGREIIVARASEELFVLNALGRVVRTVKRSAKDKAFALSPGGRYLSIAEGPDVVTTSPGSADSPRRSNACGAAAPTAMAWTSDEQHLVVACEPRRGDTTVRVLSASGQEERELTSTRESASLEIEGQKVAVVGPNDDVLVFDVASGQELHRIARPAQASDAPVLSRALDRAVFTQYRNTTSITLASASGPFGPRFAVKSYFLTVHQRKGNLLEIAGDLGPMLLDLATFELSKIPRGATLSADGTTYLTFPSGADSFALVNRVTGKELLVSNSAGRLNGCSFSAHGRWVHCTSEEADGKTRMRLYDAKTGKLRASYRTDTLLARDVYEWNSDDSLFEEGGNVQRTRDGAVCPDCLAAEVFDALSGRRLMSVAPARRDAARPRFLADGKHLYWERQVFDARTGRLVWTLPNTMKIINSSWEQGNDSEVAAWTAPQGLLVNNADKTLLLDYATGKVLREMAAIDAAGSISPGARFFLAREGEAIYRWDMSTWTRIPGRLPSSGFSDLSEDGELAYGVRDDLQIHRFSDGRTLRRALPLFDFEITDQGVYDPTTAAADFALVRRGPDVYRSPLEPLSSLEPKLRHPGLFADFVAGKFIAPKP